MNYTIEINVMSMNGLASMYGVSSELTFEEQDQVLQKLTTAANSLDIDGKRIVVRSTGVKAGYQTMRDGLAKPL